MVSPIHISFNAEDRSYFAILKKEIHALATNAGFSERRTAKIDIIVAEMTSNLLKHAGGGEILATVTGDADDLLLEIISVDNGPGIADLGNMLKDGHSTSNTLGQGLGSMSRLSDFFQVYSQKDWGTIVLARIYKKAKAAGDKKMLADVRHLIVAKPGETVSGDGAAYSLQADKLRIFLGDGLGHGADAHKAVNAAADSFMNGVAGTPTDTLRKMHVDVKKTRGLVGTVANFSFKEKKWRICGIGNISSKIFTAIGAKNLLPYNGIIGLNIPNTLKDQELEYFRGQILVMCSDGIKSRWELQRYPGIQKYDPTIIAVAIYKDYARKTDDMSVLVAKINGLQ